MNLEAKDKKNKGNMPLVILLLLLLLILAAAGVGYKLHEDEMPRISLAEEIGSLGKKKEISFAAEDLKSGIQEIRAVFVQEGKEVEVYRKEIARQGYFSASGPNRLEDSFPLDPKTIGLQEGKGELVISVQDFSWRNWRKGNRTAVSQPVVVDTKPPMISVIDATRYIKNGGAGVVTYRSSEPIKEHGVMLNNRLHPGHPLAGRGENVYVAFVAVPFDAEAIGSSFVTGADQAGNVSQAVVGMIFRPKPLKSDRINISDGFLAGKMPEFAMHYELPGTPLEQYLTVNNRIRQENNQKIEKVCGSSLPERQWQGTFLRMARSAPRANFAEHRSYYYEDRKIDEQYHLGVDLASVQHAEVETANPGKVVLAEYLGIYGNTVIVDHGQGLFSLYSHLSQIKVNPGDQVAEKAVLGMTGISGMAGGDHLHFSILVNGVFVDPVEWWDPHWLQVSILDFL